MDKNIKPLVSIIMITRNRASFITRAIQSVQKQDLSNWELLILDDASTDKTEKIVTLMAQTDPRIRYIKNVTVLGIPHNRNQGLALAQGDYMAVLDSDDEWLETDKLTRQISFLTNNPDHILIGSNINIVNEQGELIKTTTFATTNTTICQRILCHNQVAHSSVVFKTEAVRKLNGYNTAITVAEDFDLILRLGTIGKLANLPETTTAYTIHQGGISTQKRVAISLSHLKIVWKNFGQYPRWFSGILFSLLRVVKAIVWIR